MRWAFAAVGPHWSRLSARERAAVVAAIAVAASALGWVALWQPLRNDLAATEQALLEMRARLAQAKERANDIAVLSRESRPPATADARAAVERLLSAQGRASAAGPLDAQDGGVRVTFAAIGLDTLVPFVAAAGREEHLFPVEMTLTRRVEPGRVRAELTLAR